MLICIHVSEKSAYKIYKLIQASHKIFMLTNANIQISTHNIKVNVKCIGLNEIMHTSIFNWVDHMTNIFK